MAKKIFHISGHVIDHKSRRSIAGHKFEAWDKDLHLDDLVGSTDTQAAGLFKYKCDATHFKQLFLIVVRISFFKVFREKQLLADTRGGVL